MKDDSLHFRIFLYFVGFLQTVFVFAFCIMVIVLVAMFNETTDFLGKELSIHNFQTLITGMLALLGAWLTVRMIRKQVRQSDQQADDIRVRKLNAARATMPIALSFTCDYAEQYAEYAHFIYLEAKGIPDTVAPNLPKLPDEAIGVLKDCIEYASEGEEKPIIELLSSLQVMHARLQIARQSSGRPVNFPSIRYANSWKHDAQALYLKTSDLFSYARQEKEPPSRGGLFLVRPDLRIRDDGE